MVGNRITLNYGKVWPKHWRLRSLSVVMIAAVFIAGSYWSSITTWVVRHYFFWEQRRCLDFRMPPDTIAFESCVPGRHQISGSVFRLQSAPQNEVTNLEQTTSCWRIVRANYEKRCWAPSPDYPNFPSPGGGVVFLHRMLTRSGDEVLVHADIAKREHGAVILEYEVYDSDALSGNGTIF
jgi:hypothetical protein